MRTRDETAWVVVHCSATPPGMDIGRNEIDDWHRDRGWDMIGYHLVVRRNGVVEIGRPIDCVGAHVQGSNHITVGVCWIGGIEEGGTTPEDNRTEEQVISLRSVVETLAKVYGAGIRGHRDFPNVNKACPSFDVRMNL